MKPTQTVEETLTLSRPVLVSMVVRQLSGKCKAQTPAPFLTLTNVSISGLIPVMTVESTIL